MTPEDAGAVAFVGAYAVVVLLGLVWVITDWWGGRKP